MVPRPGAAAVPVELAPRPIGGPPMTEEAWLACEEPTGMVSVLAQSAYQSNERKARLCSVAFCLRLKASLLHPNSRAALEVALLYADNVASNEEREAAWQGAVLIGACSPILHALAVGQSISDVAEAAQAALAGERCETDELAVQCSILHDIFGNPFRPVAFDPAWRTDTAVSLARGMYDSREFGAMPILADALQDAGCEDEQILLHCRESGPHVRGCWVCDLVLGL
jgi:hypothetical protein